MLARCLVLVVVLWCTELKLCDQPLCDCEDSAISFRIELPAAMSVGRYDLDSRVEIYVENHNDVLSVHPSDSIREPAAALCHDFGSYAAAFGVGKGAVFGVEYTFVCSSRRKSCKGKRGCEYMYVEVRIA